MWPVGSRELCRPRTEVEGKLVAESDLSRRAPAPGKDVAGLGRSRRGWRGRLPWLGCGEGGEFGFGLRAVVVELAKRLWMRARMGPCRAEGQDAQPRSWRVTW